MRRTHVPIWAEMRHLLTVNSILLLHRFLLLLMIFMTGMEIRLKFAFRSFLEQTPPQKFFVSFCFQKLFEENITSIQKSRLMYFPFLDFFFVFSLQPIISKLNLIILSILTVLCHRLGNPLLFIKGMSETLWGKTTTGLYQSYGDILEHKCKPV